MYRDEIIDAHHHLWDLEENYYPWLSDKPKTIWLGDYSKIRKNYLPSDYKKDNQKHNVVGSIHIQALIDDNYPEKETQWLQEQYEKVEFPNGIVAYADLLSPNCEEVLKSHVQYNNIRGIRYILNWHEDEQYCLSLSPDIMENEQFIKNYALLEKYNLSFDMQLYPNQMQMASKLIKKFPNIKVIINHTGMPILRTSESFEQWKKDLQYLSDLPNVAIKLSGLGMIDHSWNINSIRPYILSAIRIFGTKRCIFASNFPVDSLYSSFDELYTRFKEIVKDLPYEEQRDLFYESAKKWYRLDNV